ncbi:MAG: histidine ammonia-lyase [Bacteroidales bacterium]|nr:histidine ammonia-lyase [Bacteroidales bacterium]MBN2755760.1 histidine ammonia-lyase [Bacteroidales bacterium]
MSKTHYISNENLNFTTLQNIVNQKLEVKLSEQAKQDILKCRNYLDKKIENIKDPIYGITTGFGALHNISISKDELSQLQTNLVMSHASGTGEEVNSEIIKLMLLFKAHALSFGYSGVQLETVERILDFYNNDIIPIVYQLGSLGASGDLAPLAHLFLPLLGLGEVRYKGEKMDAKEILIKFNWKPIILQSKEGLALLNGTQFMSSHGVYALLKTFKLSKLADIIAAISLEAYDGRIEPFFDQIHQIRAHKGQIETAENFRNMLNGSQIISRKKEHVQDPYSFRCIPQVHGASKDTINYVASVLQTEINSVTDNPTVFPDEDLIISGGNFHGQPLALAFDFLSIAVAELGSISERRVYRLISGNRNLPEFLVSKPGLNSGFMIPQYAAASIVSQNKQLCTPTSVDSIPSSNEQEDHVSMGGNGATKLIKVVDNLERILAIELLNAAQAIEFRKPLKTSEYLQNFISEFRKNVSFMENDQIMYKAIKKAVLFLQKVEI